MRQPILRFYARFALLPLILFVCIILLIRFQSYDNQELRQILAPDDCAASCFMGIKPGFTTSDEALHILKSSRWVEHMTVGSILISWTWNGGQPQWIDESQPSRMTVSVNAAGREVVNEISIPTRISAGSIMLAMQNPLGYMLTSNIEADGTKAHFLSFRYNDLIIKGQFTCPSRVYQFIARPASITFYNHSNANFDFEEQFWASGRFVSFATDAIICH